MKNLQYLCGIPVFEEISVSSDFFTEVLDTEALKFSKKLTIVQVMYVIRSRKLFTGNHRVKRQFHELPLLQVLRCSTTLDVQISALMAGKYQAVQLATPVSISLLLNQSAAIRWKNMSVNVQHNN